MLESIKMIKFCSVISLICLISFYFTTVDTETYFVKLDFLGISNDFFTTVFGGVFASIITVGACEYQKYRIMKFNTENYLFYQGFYLYQALIQLKQNVEDYIKHSGWLVAENLLDESIRMIQCEVTAIQRVEYITFLAKRNVMINIHERFRKECMPDMNFLQSGTVLRIVINEEKIKYLQNNIYPPANFTSQNIQIRNTLNGILEKTTLYAVLVDNYIDTLNEYCNNRFKYKTMKNNMLIPHIKM